MSEPETQEILDERPDAGTAIEERLESIEATLDLVVEAQKDETKALERIARALEKMLKAYTG